jgi:hypothetical protein
MTFTRMRNTLKRRPRRRPEEAVRFHNGPQGVPVPCFDSDCAVPHLNVSEAGITAPD